MKGELDELLEIVKYLIFVVVKINFIFKKQVSHIANKINLILYGEFFMLESMVKKVLYIPAGV